MKQWVRLWEKMNERMKSSFYNDFYVNNGREIDEVILMIKYPPIISRTAALNFRTSIEFSMLVATNDTGLNVIER